MAEEKQTFTQKPQEVNAVAGRILVQKTVGRKKNATATDAEETIEADIFHAPHAMVSCGMGVTVNMGNYESCKVDVHVSIPCYPAEVAQAYNKVRGWCEQVVRREIDLLKKPASAKINKE